jgi:hypothetical protein
MERERAERYIFSAVRISGRVNDESFYGTGNDNYLSIIILNFKSTSSLELELEP